MLTYPKIETVYVRDPTGRVDTARLRMPEVDLIRRWLVMEKIDGTNIRIVVRPGGISAGIVAAGDSIPTDVEFLGRTDKAQTPKFLLNRLAEMFPVDRLDAAIQQDVDTVILFGEGYGARIQKGGGNYRPDDVSFRLFDIAVDALGDGDYWWLEWEAVENIAEELGIKTVPVLLRDATLAEAVDAVLTPSVTAYEDARRLGYVQEGIVARTVPQLFTRRHQRLIWKLKNKDFA